MNKLQKQVIESCIDTRDVFDEKRLVSSKSFSNQMEKKRYEENLIMEARIRNIKKNHQQKYESLHQTYLYQCEQLKQQLQSEIKKEMYSFEKKMEMYLKQISENDYCINKNSIQLGSNNNSFSQQFNDISQTLCTEQTLNQSSVNDLFNFVESHDNSLFNKQQQQNQSSFIQQSSIISYNNQPSSFRAGTPVKNNKQMHCDDMNNDRNSKSQHFADKENYFEQYNFQLGRNQKSKSILKNNYNQINGFDSIYKKKSNQDSQYQHIQINQNQQNIQQNASRQKNWDAIKQIRQSLREKQSSPQSIYTQTKKQEKNYSVDASRMMLSKQKKHPMQEVNQNLNRSFQVSRQENIINNNFHNLSFTNLNQFEDQVSFQRCDSSSSSDSDSHRHLDTDRLKRFKIDNINLIKTIQCNQKKSFSSQLNKK
ncbi:hypothetical protein ABPG72_009999 [Tetrahymena utriculariae]